jgi:hypothetical protein
MICTKHEALMILGKWFEERSPVLLNFQATPATEVICLKGRITQLKTDSFLFTSPIASVTVPFDQATFEYEEKLLMDPPFRKEMSGPSSRVGLHLSLCRSQLKQDDASSQLQSFLSISEVP